MNFNIQTAIICAVAVILIVWLSRLYAKVNAPRCLMLGSWHVPPHLLDKFSLGCFMKTDTCLYVEDDAGRVVYDAAINMTVIPVIPVKPKPKPHKKGDKRATDDIIATYNITAPSNCILNGVVALAKTNDPAVYQIITYDYKQDDIVVIAEV